MKIAIFTQPLHTNYGGLLQAFALQKILKKEFKLDSTTINIQMDSKWSLTTMNIFKNFIKKYVFLKKGITIFPFIPSQIVKDKIAVNSNLFICENINTTPKISRYDKDILKKFDFDTFIVGSDQVWRPKYSPDIYTYFLDFLRGNNTVKKISYAASFGVDQWEYTEQQWKICKPLLKEFNSVSVREDSAVELCETYMETKATRVLDPTMLLDKKDYESIMTKNTSFESNDYIMFYVLDPKLLKGALVTRIKEDLNLKLKRIMPLAYTKDNSENIEKCVYPPVSDWLTGFYNAKYVVTDSFHGTAFSILFNKQFVALGNVERGMSRFTSLLKLFGLENRLVVNLEQIDHGILEENIDYEKVNKLLDFERKESIKFLSNSLGR